MTMIKHAVVLLFVLSFCADDAMTETLEVSVDREAARAGEPITGTAMIANPTDETADWIVDIGPEGGDGGGTVVGEGTPERICTVAASHTGRYLRRTLDRDPGAAKKRGRAPARRKRG